ncbi:MAG: SUMF1/EgtB/PvdO family nonheme iron enzyme [Nitrospirae bacterium]|nr:SUMF1/EgtB/PvdO family nonheme iron enzyme [Nitrospirota bacterium]
MMREVKPPAPPDGMAYIPEGWFLMGSNEKDGLLGLAVGVDEIPQHRVYLKGYYIDLYEVTVGEFRKFLDITGRRTPRIWKVEEWVKIYPVPKINHPMNAISWYDADDYCRWVGKRLPTEEEWEKAARGTDGRQWPWGNEPNVPEDLKANTLEALTSWTTPVGSYPQGVSPYGVYDMGGNVMEWTSSWYKPYPGSTLKREAFGEKYKVLRGGSFENPSVPFARTAYRHSVAPQWDHPGHGFRCALDAE